MPVLSALRYLRLTSFDTSTADGRAAERYRVATLSFAANLGGRGLALVVMLLGVNLTLPYLGNERFGVWMTIMSFAAMFAFMDLGVSNALANRVTQSAADQRDSGRIQRTISGGLGFLVIVGAAATTILTTLAAVLPWDWLLKSDDVALVAEARLAAMWFGAMFGIAIVSSGVQRVYAGLQRAYEYHVAGATASLVSIAALWACSSLHADIPTLLVATMGVQLAAALPMVVLLARRGLLRWRDMTGNARVEAPALVRIGSLFLVLQLGVMVGWGADSLIVSSALGIAQVAVYGIAQRLMQLLAIPISLANAPLWAAYSDAHTRGDSAFIHQTLRRSMVSTFWVSMVGVAVLAVAAEPVISRWTHGKVDVPLSTIMAFGAWTILEALGNAFAMALNGCGVVKPQVVAVIVFCIIVTPMKLWLVHSSGIDGVLMATIVSYLVAVPMLYATVFRKTITAGLQSRGADAEVRDAAMTGSASHGIVGP